MKPVLLFVVLVTACRSSEVDLPAESQEVIDTVNAAHTTWKAGRNFEETMRRSQVLQLLGLRKRERKNFLPVQRYRTPLKKFPDSFDSREHWPDCNASISHIRDQAYCGSCWAVSAAATFSDRLCIATAGRVLTSLSAGELMSCCHKCGDGCNGGYDQSAWQYFKRHGIVTGGDYHSRQGCQPYPMKPCEHHINRSSTASCRKMENRTIPTPQCHLYCTNNKYKVPFKKDHHKTKKSYMVQSTVKSIQHEIMKHGPVQAGFTVYSDFLSYRTGVYQHVTGKKEGGHAVKIIGWGVDNSTPYWLVANSWNTDWGDQGYFKIRRGNNECDFESEISAGIPKTKNLAGASLNIRFTALTSLLATSISFCT